MSEVKSIRVALDGKRDYDILIAGGILHDAGRILKDRFGTKRLFIVRDPNVDAHYATLEASLIAAGHSVSGVTLSEGEGAKTWDAMQNTVAALLDNKADRYTMVVALGGGVVGDHAGFAAAMTLRGLDYVQVPTTLLAQVDSSVGGKTGINTPQGKNLIGAFHQPHLVLIDTTTLATLPDRHMRAGYAEIVKYGFIRDAAFFEWLETNAASVLARDDVPLAHAIATSCQAKATIVGADERETAERALLNFGHTFGHALEAACHYDRRLLHGEAVAVGMALAFEASVRAGLCPQADADKAIKHMARLGLPTRILHIKDFPRVGAQELVNLMANDKKAKDGKLTFILTRGVGQAFVTQDVAPAVILETIAASMRVS